MPTCSYHSLRNEETVASSACCVHSALCSALAKKTFALAFLAVKRTRSFCTLDCIAALDLEVTYEAISLHRQPKSRIAKTSSSWQKRLLIYYDVVRWHDQLV